MNVTISTFGTEKLNLNTYANTNDKTQSDTSIKKMIHRGVVRELKNDSVIFLKKVNVFLTTIIGAVINVE